MGASFKVLSGSLYKTVRESTLPGDLRNILDEVRRLQLDRLPISLEGDFPQIEETGMSPKKVHEVSRMVAYILQIIRINKWDPSVLRIVDVGAGQVCSKYYFIIRVLWIS